MQNPKLPTEKTNFKKHIELLGHKVKDKITGMEGICDCISFDLYGCIQASINQGITKDTGKRKESFWMDVSRLEIKSKKRAIDIPNFGIGLIAEGKKGPAEKSSFNK